MQCLYGPLTCCSSKLGTGADHETIRCSILLLLVFYYQDRTDWSKIANLSGNNKLLEYEYSIILDHIISSVLIWSARSIPPTLVLPTREGDRSFLIFLRDGKDLREFAWGYGGWSVEMAFVEGSTDAKILEQNQEKITGCCRPMLIQ
jgi:hypothetical protein